MIDEAFLFKKENLQYQENQRFSGHKKTKVFFGKKTRRKEKQNMENKKW